MEMESEPSEIHWKMWPNKPAGSSVALRRKVIGAAGYP